MDPSAKKHIRHGVHTLQPFFQVISHTATIPQGTYSFSLTLHSLIEQTLVGTVGVQFERVDFAKCVNQVSLVCAEDKRRRTALTSSA